MAALEAQLEPGEWFVCAARPHALRWAIPLAIALPGVLLWIEFHSVILMLLALAAAIALAVPLVVERRRARFIVTNRRLIMREVFSSQPGNSIPLEQIKDLALELYGFGQWVNGGRIGVTTADGHHYTLPWMQHPRGFRRMAIEQQTLLESVGRG